MDRGAWWAAVHGVANSWTRLSDFTFTFPFHALEKEMATHSIVLAWRIPRTREPGGLPSMGSHRVGHDWSDLAAAAAAYPLRNCLQLFLQCHFNLLCLSYSLCLPLLLHRILYCDAVFAIALFWSKWSLVLFFNTHIDIFQVSIKIHFTLETLILFRHCDFNYV